MKRKDGFMNQILLLIPEEFHDTGSELSRQLFLTDIGYFPRAADHLVFRPEGTEGWILILCTDGRGWFEQNETETGRQELSKNQMLLLPPGKGHSYGSQEDDWWEIYWLHFRGTQAEKWAEKLGGPFHNLPLVPGTESLHLFALMCSHLEQGISSRSFELTCFRLWHLFGSLDEERNRGTTENQGVVRAACDIMLQKAEDKLTLDELSLQLNLTSPYLCRLFKKSTGHSPMDYFIRLKIQRACRYLDMTDRSSAEICRTVSIDDPYYFSRVFSRIMGLSPRAYRNRQR